MLVGGTRNDAIVTEKLGIYPIRIISDNVHDSDVAFSLVCLQDINFVYIQYIYPQEATTTVGDDAL